MTEAHDEPAPPAPKAPTRARRTPKFSLPDHHHDEQAGDKIEAFLDGPHQRRRRSRSQRHSRMRAIALVTDREWSGALRYEAARSTRYGRPMAILLVDLTADAATAGPDGLAVRLTEVLGREVRETDRAVRARPERFLVLLPETTEDQAAHLASRIERAYRHTDETLVTGEIRIEIAVPRHGTDPEEAIAGADRRMADAALAG